MKIGFMSNFNSIIQPKKVQRQSNTFSVSALSSLKHDTVSFGAWPKIFKQLDGVTVDNVKSLSNMELDYLNTQAGAKINEETVNNTSKFVNILKSNLDKTYGANRYVFVSIGQSPAAIGELLNISGVETAVCPISGLSDLKNINGILKNPNLNKYFDYLKTQGVDPQKIKQSGKKYLFVDYASTGNSLKRFEELMRNKKAGFNLPNVSFISLQDLIYDSNLSSKDEAFADDFIDKYMKDTVIKKYSSIFKLPPNELDKVQEYRDATPANENLNMLKFLVMQKTLVSAKAA